MPKAKTASSGLGTPRGKGRISLRSQAASTDKKRDKNHVTSEKDPHSIRAVAKALELLQVICEDEAFLCGAKENVRVTEISRRLGIGKGAVSRLMATMEDCGFLERETDTCAYRIGMNAYELGRKLLSRMNLLKQARPVMEDLARRCNESVYLAVPRGVDFLFLDYVDNTQFIKIAPLHGYRFPVSNSSPGKLMQAYSALGVNLSQELSADQEAQAVHIRQQGFHHENGGLGDSIACLSAPVFNFNGGMIGALCLVGPNFRMTEMTIEETLIPLVKEASEIISSKLGYHAHLQVKTRL